MQLIRIFLKSTLIFAALLVLPVWLVGTNHGLNTVLAVGCWFIPGKVTYKSAEGTLISNKIILKHIKFSKNAHILQIDSVNIYWRKGIFTAYKINGFADFIPLQDLIVAENNATLSSLHGRIIFGQVSQNLQLKTTGIWKKSELSGNINLSHIDDGTWVLNSASLKIGDNFACLIPASHDGFSWKIDLIQPQILFINGVGKLNAEGTVEDLNSQPKITAKIHSNSFALSDYAIKNLAGEIYISTDYKAPFKVNIGADNLNVKNITTKALNFNINGSLEKHEIRSSLKFETHPINLNAIGSLNKDTWNSDNIRINYRQEALAGNAEFNINNINGELNLRGKMLGATTKAKFISESKEHFNLNLQVKINEQNNVQAVVDYDTGKINGLISAQAEDLSTIMQLLPEVTRLKGKLNAELKLTGKIDKPIININAHLTNITATIPTLGIKIKPMELHLHDNGHGKFILTGSGKMRRGPGEFTINGYIEPFKPNIPNSVTINTKSLEFINNDHAQLIASNNVSLAYDFTDNRLDIVGDVNIERGKIHLDGKNSATVKSKDVVFTDEKELPKRNIIALNPKINLRISDAVHFTGYGLDADISGKLAINQRHNATYGTGRITIKQGKYKLPGQTLQIQDGRLLYPPGTLLANPTLDIKMQGKNKMSEHDHIANGSDIELLVRGTAQSPIIHEAGIGNNKDRALSQAILAGSSMLTNNLVQDKLKITELGITSDQQDRGFFHDPTKSVATGKNKDIVVGRSLGNRLYLQYLHGIAEDNKNAHKKVRLKYALSKNWAIGVESGNQGTGADLSFSIETD